MSPYPIVPGGLLAADEFKLRAFERPMQRFTRGLLPNGARFTILHDEISSPDAEHLKGESLAIDRGGVHEAAAASRSVSCQNGYLPNDIVDEVARH